MATGRIAGVTLGSSLICLILLAGCSESETPVAPPGAVSGTPAAGTGTGAGTGVGTAGTGAVATAGSGVAGALSTAGTGAGTGVIPSAGTGAAGSGVAGTGPVAGTGEAGTAAAAPSWPMMGYDSNNTYFNPTETKLTVANAPMLQEKWRFMIAGYPPGSPVIGEGKVFVMATGGTYGIDLATGMKVWEKLDIVGTASAAYDNGFVYLHSYTGQLYKVKASDGSVVWGPVESNANTFCDGMSSPIVGGGLVMVGHSCGEVELGAMGDPNLARGGVGAFDIETGMKKWTYFTVPESGENGAMVWSTVSVDLDAKVMFAATGNNYTVLGENSDAIHAVDLMTGVKKWKQQVHMDDRWTLLQYPTGPDTDFGANPILGTVDGKKVIGNGDKGSNFYMFDRETGAVLWHREKLSTSRNAQNGGVLMNGAFDGTYFYVVSNQPPNAAVLHALDPKKMGADAWPAKTFTKTTWGAPSLANGLLVVPNDDDLYVLNAMSGEQLAKFTTGGTIAAGAATIADGRIVVQSGLSYALDPTAKVNNLVICYGLP